MKLIKYLIATLSTLILFIISNVVYAGACLPSITCTLKSKAEVPRCTYKGQSDLPILNVQGWDYDFVPNKPVKFFFKANTGGANCKTKLGEKSYNKCLVHCSYKPIEPKDKIITIGTDDATYTINVKNSVWEKASINKDSWTTFRCHSSDAAQCKFSNNN